jgi:Leucine-rich repeat (LRR) protein
VFVDLDFNELTGSLPATLYSLTNLETLDLNDNFLEGNIGSIGVFSNLGFLQLQSKRRSVSFYCFANQ